MLGGVRMDDYKNMQCLLWAAIMSNGGELEIHDKWIRRFWADFPIIERVNQSHKSQILLKAKLNQPTPTTINDHGEE